MMRKLGDVLRVFAWCLVVAGLAIGSISFSHVSVDWSVTLTRSSVQPGSS